MSLSGSDNLKNLYARIRYLLAKFFKTVKETGYLSDRNWKWISMGSLFVILLLTLGFLIFFSDSLSFPWLIISGLMIASLPFLYGALIKLGLVIAGSIPKKAGWLIFAAGALFFIYFQAPIKGRLVELFYMLFTFLFIFGSLSNFSRRYWKKLSRTKKLANIFFFSVGVCNLFLLIYFLAYPGPEKKASENFSLEAKYMPARLDRDDPAGDGNFKYSELSYGAGKDRHRKEFGDSAEIRSYTVDGSSFIENWDKLAGKIRTAYWGFGKDSLPLNGTIWLPEGPGPFPLILMVHGNHLDRDFSDSGYAYLGQHFATHGFMAISVDENFLNGSLTDFKHPLAEENDARGWLLLKHLEMIRERTGDSTSVLFGKADMENVILVGHSRGGEAVSIAASFNPLEYYPDNAEEVFDFNFGIKGIVALAQVDGQYYPSGIETPIENVNYLSIQGSMDADLDSYTGLRQFNRVKFTDTSFHFKAGIYIQNANHGQFNTSWGINDIGFPNGMLLNRRLLLEKEEQERIAKVYISTFINATFEVGQDYLQLFTDYRLAREWLPKTLYINQYQDNRSCIIANYEEDIDLVSTSSGLAEVKFSELADTYEKKVSLKKGSSGTKAVFLGWNNEKDSVPGGYELLFKEPLNVTAESFQKLQFDVYSLRQDPGERYTPSNEETPDVEPDPSENEQAGEKLSGEEPKKDIDSGRSRKKDKEKDSEKEEALGFEIMLVDASDEKAVISLSDHFPVNPIFSSHMYKLDILYKNSDPEPIPQHIEIGLEHFRNANPLLDVENLKSISFVFSEGEKGMIALDNIGFASLKK